MCSECCYNLCVYAPGLLTALTVAFHTIFVTKSTILISTRSSVMIVPTSQFEYVLQALNTLTQESADDERVEDDPETIRYPERAPSEKRHSVK